ncbi:unnamed protein product, partial [Didymodactylos carnosus]
EDSRGTVGIALLAHKSQENIRELLSKFQQIYPVKREFRRRNKIPHLSEALNILMMLFNLKTHIQDFENVRQELTSFTIQNTKYPEFMKECVHILTDKTISLFVALNGADYNVFLYQLDCI